MATHILIMSIRANPSITRIGFILVIGADQSQVLYLNITKEGKYSVIEIVLGRIISKNKEELRNGNCRV